MNIKIRDLRKKDQYKIDDAYLNGYARLCGVYATAVYNSLSRHADFHTQECFPSIEKMAEQHGIDRKTIMRGIAELEKWGIVMKIKTRDPKSNRQLPNVYILVDKSMWLPKPSPSQGHGAESFSGTEPSPSQSKSRVPVKDYKDTHTKDTQLRRDSLEKLKLDLIQKKILW